MKRSHFGVLPVIALAACAPKLAPLPALAERASPAAAASCDDGEEIDERLVVDWSPLDRSRLESAVRSGLVLVRVEGCRARIVDTCTVRRPYAFSATSRQREIMLVRDSGELGVKLPLLATRFGANVSRSSALDVTMTVVGRFEAGAAALSASDVEGACSGVTHLVSSVSVGAFAISTADEASASASADLLVAGSRAAYAHERRHVDSAGIEERCSHSRRADAAPPEDCAIPLRVELRRLTAQASPPTRPPPLPAPAASSDEMRRAMDLAKKQLVPCHRAARASAPDLAGLLTLGIKLGRRGNVRSVSAKHEGGLPDGLSACAAERVALVSFPPADDDRPRVLVVPLLFRPLAESSQPR